MPSLADLEFKNPADSEGKFVLPELGFSFDALEPYMDAATIEIHHGKHHQTYVNKLNEAIAKAPNLSKLSIEEILADLSIVPDEIKTPVINHGGGHANHSLFWSILGNNSAAPSKDLTNAIEKSFGNLSALEEKLNSAAVGVFGSGWAWLCLTEEGNLEISQTANQDSPLSKGKVPILVLDVWEHAYYLKYQNRRPEFVNNLIRLIDWEKVSARYNNALKLIK